MEKESIVRIQTMVNIVLSLTVCVLAALLMLRSGEVPKLPDDAVPKSSALQVESTSASSDAGPTHQQLAKIDSRLALLESSVSRQNGSSALAQPPPPMMPPGEADRRLRQMLPVSQIDQDDMMAFYSRLSTLAPEEQRALSTAFSRAINQNRIRMRP
jgi:hypothetical protein